jgi:hypothetical protein
MPNPTRKNTLFALLFIVIGLFVVAMAAGLVPVDESDINAPLWLLGLVGVIFMIAGVMIRLGRKNRYNDLLAALLMLAMGAIGVWVAVYSASGEISGGIFFLPSATNVMLGRILFGTGSLICFAMAAYALNRFFRRSD